MRNVAHSDQHQSACSRTSTGIGVKGSIPSTVWATVYVALEPVLIFCRRDQPEVALRLLV